MHKKNVMIAGVWGENKGDRAIYSFLVEKLRRNAQIGKIYVSTVDVDLLKNFSDEKVEIIPFVWHGNKPFHNWIYKNVKFTILRDKVIKKKNQGCYFSELSKTMKDRKQLYKELDYIIFTGGHHITSLLVEDGISKVTYEMGEMYMSGVKYTFWTQTVGPLELRNYKNGEYYEIILKQADRFYIRDNYTEKEMKSMFPQLNNLYKSEDSVFGIYELYKDKILNAKRKCKVGISIYYTNIKSEEELNIYENKLHKLCSYIVEEGYNIEFFPMETDVRELEIINRIIDGLNADKISIFDTNVDTIMQMLEISTCQLYIGHKTHSVIMALTCGIPLIALCYHQKTYDFMCMYGLNEYAIMDTDFEIETFKRKFVQLVDRRVECRDKIIEKTESVSKKVNKDFDDLMEYIIKI